MSSLRGARISTALARSDLNSKLEGITNWHRGRKRWDSNKGQDRVDLERKKVALAGSKRLHRVFRKRGGIRCRALTAHWCHRCTRGTGSAYSRPAPTPPALRRSESAGESCSLFVPRRTQGFRILRHISDAPDKEGDSEKLQQPFESAAPARESVRG